MKNKITADINIFVHHIHGKRVVYIVASLTL